MTTKTKKRLTEIRSMTRRVITAACDIENALGLLEDRIARFEGLTPIPGKHALLMEDGSFRECISFWADDLLAAGVDITKWQTKATSSKGSVDLTKEPKFQMRSRSGVELPQSLPPSGETPI